MYENFLTFVRELYDTRDFIPLHEPRFKGNEIKYLRHCIDTNFVSSVGEFVDRFEKEIADYTGSKYAIATVNGTAALHMGLILGGVKRDDEVITQSLSFIATTNAIRYCEAIPRFIDVDQQSLGLSPESLENYLFENCEVRDDKNCWNKKTGKIVRACVPMHTFGFPSKISEIREITKKYNIFLIEDAAESLGSTLGGEHTGTFGDIGIVSFNGNKIITTGGGGMILTNDKKIAEEAKHITTTAKLKHQWEFNHDQVGYNYRMPNINAALGVAQIERIEEFIDRKRKIANSYIKWGQENSMDFFQEPTNARSNYWLNVMITEDRKERDNFLQFTNNEKVMTRPTWTPMHKLEIFKTFCDYELPVTDFLSDRIINVPSSVI